MTSNGERPGTRQPRLLPATRRILFGTLTAGALTAAASPAHAQADSGTYIVRDFRFADGSTLPELRLHYVTLGKPGRDAVLIIHGTGGSSQQFLQPIFAGELFGAGQPFDTATHFIILPDAIGHGRSSKPSDGLHARFPRYTYDDMARAEHRLVTERLGVRHLRLVMGTSMGCMHSWIWAETWPTVMDGVVPLACIPTRIAGRNRLWRRVSMDAIRTDPGWAGGDYQVEPPGLKSVWALVLMVSGNASLYQRLAPTPDSADAYLAAAYGRLAGSGFGDANDALYALDASRDYDPSGGLEQITARVLAINSADDQINPPDLGLMERLIPRVRGARYVLIPESENTVGHGTHTKAAVWKSYLAEFLATLPRGPAPSTYRLDPTPATVTWGYYAAGVAPALRIHSGETVEMRTLITSSPKRLEEAGVAPGDVEPALRDIFDHVTDKGPGGHILTGPVYVEGAEPGDVLEVRIRSVRLAIPYAYNAFGPGHGFLPDDYPYYRMKIIPLDQRRMVAHFAPGIDVPLHPFFGSLGDAPPEASGRISSAPPWIHAGNLDDKYLVEGTTLYIPVHAPGALFWAGDGHAGQGDGEVDITALETSLVGTFQLVVRKDMHLLWPRAETPEYYMTMGINEDLNEATKLAVREMIAFLVSDRHLSRDDAYMLASVTADLHISELVDGNKVVSMMLPKAVFQPADRASGPRP